MLKLKLANEIRIASRTIIHNFSRYLALVLLTLFSFAIALSSLAIMNGMLYSMREKARVYYGGDLQFIGGNGSLNIYNSEELTSRLEKILASHISIRSRIDYGADYDKILFFEGNSVPIRIIKGLDFAVNHDLFQYFNFLSGSFYEVEKDNGILISSAIAEKLQVKVGDSLTLYLDNFQRKIDTTQVVIKGIFLDTSLFGMYSVYMDLENLRNTINAPKDYINRIGLYFPKGKEPSRFEIENIQKLLENEFGIEHIHPLSNDKDDFYAAMYKTKSRPYYALIPLDANLKDLRQIIEAMKIIIYGLSALLIIIVMIGISSTYRVIIAKRVREIGIYVSQGFSDRRIALIFLSEVIFIIITGFLAGILSAFAISYFVSSLDFSSIPAFDLFLSNGSLLSRYSFIHTLVIFSSVFVTTLVSVLFTIRKAIQIDPAKALSNPE